MLDEADYTYRQYYRRCPYGYTQNALVFLEQDLPPLQEVRMGSMERMQEVNKADRRL